MRYPVLVTSVLAAVALAAPPVFARLGEPPPFGEHAPHVVPADLGSMQAGDVIFLSAPKALWARMASEWSLPQYRHGHVGMIVNGIDGQPMVAHASGDPTRSRATVRVVTVERFLEDAETASLFRMKDAAAAPAAARRALWYARKNTLFDQEFSLSNGEKLYCSELVWLAMSAALGRDVVPVKASAYARPVIKLSDLETSPDLVLVATARAPL